MKNSATEKPEEECELEESFDLSSVSSVSIFQKKQKPQKKRTSALFEENREAQQHNKRRKNKRELEKTVMPVQELNLSLCDVCERSFDGFQNASRIKQVMVVENDKSQLVSSFVTSQETRKQMHSKNKYKDLAEIHNRTYVISRNQTKDHIPLLEAEQMLSVQIQPVEITKQSSSRNKLTIPTKVQDEKQESSVLALPSKDCTQSKNTDIYSDNSVSMSCFVPVAQQSCHNILDKKLQLPFKKQSGTQKRKKRSPAGPMRKKNEQLVSKGSLEDDHGEEQLDKKENLHPFKLRTELKRAKPQKVKKTYLPKSQTNVLYQEDSCEQHVTKNFLNVSVTSQNNEGFLSQ
ncbi:hypothetical protein E2320_002449 [Naja naja]|nr:hypothetical protein E2320_002449 [Naja naja]